MGDCEEDFRFISVSNAEKNLAFSLCSQLMYIASAALGGGIGHHKYYMKPCQMYDGGGVKEICFNSFAVFEEKQ